MPSFVRIEIARLLGWPENRVRVKVPLSRRRLRRQDLHQARGAGRGAGADRAPAGEDRAHHGGAVLHHHQASDHVPDQERRRPRTAASPRANATSAGTAAPTPTSARASRRSPASPRPGPTTSSTCSIDSYELYTNRPPAGALRGFGIPQLVWAYESHTDMIARALGIDPVEFRRRNILRDGRPQATGTIMRDAGDRARARRARRAHELVARRSTAATAWCGAAAASPSASRPSIAPTTSVAHRQRQRRRQRQRCP